MDVVRGTEAAPGAREGGSPAGASTPHPRGQWWRAQDQERAPPSTACRAPRTDSPVPCQQTPACKGFPLAGRGVQTPHPSDSLGDRAWPPYVVPPGQPIRVPTIHLSGVRGPGRVTTGVPCERVAASSGLELARPLPLLFLQGKQARCPSLSLHLCQGHLSLPRGPAYVRFSGSRTGRRV